MTTTIVTLAYIGIAVVAWGWLTLTLAWRWAELAADKDFRNVRDGVRIPSAFAYFMAALVSALLVSSWPVTLPMVAVHTRRVSTRRALHEAQETIRRYERGQL